MLPGLPCWISAAPMETAPNLGDKDLKRQIYPKISTDPMGIDQDPKMQAVRTIFQAIFRGDIPLHGPYIG